MILLLLACRMQEYLGIKPVEPLPACMSLAWHPMTSQVAISSSNSHVHVCNAGAAPLRKQRQDAADLQSELLLWHEVQLQVRSAACLSWPLIHCLWALRLPPFAVSQRAYDNPAYVSVIKLQIRLCVDMDHLPNRHHDKGCA